MKNAYYQNYHAQRLRINKDDVFKTLVSRGLTAEELCSLIAKNPKTWRQFEHWVPKLPRYREDNNEKTV